MVHLSPLMFFAIAVAVALDGFNSQDTTAAAPDSDEPATPPNVVLIFMDDMGYADINPFGDNAYRTPNLNRLAAEGRCFRDFVVSSAVCSASRAALLTGCYHRRVGISGALGPKSEIGLNPDETTIAEICKSRGYATACFGKWHLGHNPKFLPHRQGFDRYYGIPYSNDMWPMHPATIAKRKKDPDAKSNWPELPIIEADANGYRIVKPAVTPEDQKSMTGELTRRTTEFIREHADRPFFVYLPHPMVHVPLYCGERFEGSSGAGLFGDVVAEIDWSIGEILAAIRDIDADDRTLVIFTSDNGPWLAYGEHSGQTGGLREGKGTMWEGGTREPTIMRMLGTIPPGTESTTLCGTVDILPTVAAMIGADLPPRKIDGHDIRGLMTGDGESPHAAVPGYYAGGQLQTIRDDRFKLVFPHGYRTLAGRSGGTDGNPVPYGRAQAERALYDLVDDPQETTDVIAQHPDVAARLDAAAKIYRTELGDSLTKIPGAENRPAGKMEPGDERLPLVWD